MVEDRILVVEDEKAVARELEFTFQAKGFEVLCAKNGEFAYSMNSNRSSCPFDLYINW